MRRKKQPPFSTREKVNPSFYGPGYKDLAHLTDDELVQHWRTYGAGERRIPSWTALRRAMKANGMPYREFNWPDYLALNPDLLNSPVDNPALLGLHYYRAGHAEGRPVKVTIANDIPHQILRTVPPATDDDRYWGVPYKKPADFSPRWDRRAQQAFARGSEDPLNSLSLVDFIIETYLYFLDAVPSHAELAQWCAEVDCGLRTRFEIFSLIAGHRRNMSRAEILVDLQSPLDPPVPSVDDGDIIHVMGFPIITVSEWTADAERIRRENPHLAQLPSLSNGRRSDTPLIEHTPTASVLCSLYRTDEYLDSFLGNILQQTAFHRCEFILTLVDPSDYELSTCQQIARAYHNVVLDHVEERIGIYTAWNRGVQQARGRFLTNMNVDDLRRDDSLELQINLIDSFPWIDVVYQDVFVTIDRTLGWGLVEEIGARTNLPAATISTFMSRLNPPHNGPMWRKSLHDEIGWFDETYKSAGDVDFWIRCARAGKIFYKSSDIHVAYFDNPEGMSTRVDGPGVREHREILRRHRDLLVLPRPSTFEVVVDVDEQVKLRADRISEGLIDEICRRRDSQ